MTHSALPYIFTQARAQSKLYIRNDSLLYPKGGTVVTTDHRNRT